MLTALLVCTHACIPLVDVNRPMCSYVESFTIATSCYAICVHIGLRLWKIVGWVYSTSAVWECSELCTRLCFLLSAQEPGNEATYLHANSIYQPRDNIHHNPPAHKN